MDVHLKTLPLNMKNYYQMPLDDVYKKLNSREGGLTSKEAEDRLALSGENVLKEKNKMSAKYMPIRRVLILEKNFFNSYINT